jgi:hypothetical protein
MSYNMMIGYDIYNCFTMENGASSIASKNDLDDQNLLLATVGYESKNLTAKRNQSWNSE